MNEGWEQQALGFRTLPGDSKYFGDAGKQCVLNFRVRDLDAMMAQPERCRNRRGTRSRTLSEWAVRPLYDAEGIAIELWQPAGRDAR